jgi:hypothetical protein
MGSGDNLTSQGFGSMGMFTNVLYVPNAAKNVLSVYQLLHQGFIASYSLDSGCTIRDGTRPDSVLLVAPFIDRVPQATPEAVQVFLAHGRSASNLSEHLATEPPEYPHPPDLGATSAYFTPLIVDSGATHHMMNSDFYMTKYKCLRSSQQFATVANGHRLQICGVGSCGPLQNVLHIPGLAKNLISVYQLLVDGFIPQFTLAGFSLSHPHIPNQHVLEVPYRNRLAVVDRNAFERLLSFSDTLSSVVPSCLLASTARSDLVSLWHYRLNHASSD